MPPLTDSIILGYFREALANRRFDGYIQWKPIANEWLRRNVAGATQQQVNEVMHIYVEGGGEIKQIRERRGFDAEFHYDIKRLAFGETHLYIEMNIENDRTGPTIHVRNCHYPS